MIYRIADFVIEFKATSPDFSKIYSDYIFDGVPQFTFDITPQDMERARAIYKTPVSDFWYERAIFYTKFMDWLPLHDAMFFHSSLIEVAGEGIAFTALSGTGKTTHTLLWQRLLGDKMKIINGDKPVIRIMLDGTPRAYGTPWQGKENFGENTSAPLKHICFIERSEENSCEKITPQEALKDIFSQIFIPRDPISATKTLNILNRILNTCAIWRIKCNMDISAAEVAYNTIFGGKQIET